MSERAKGTCKKDSHLARTGLIGTGIYLSALCFGIWLAVKLCLIDLAPIKLNELGDFLAGAFGPLAIFWLVLGFFQQSRELQNSVDALNLQADELSNSVNQQKEMVSVTRETLEHEREVLGLQENRRKERLQPNFIIRLSAGSRSGGALYSFGINATNTGEDVSDFSLESFENGTPWLSQTERYFKRGTTTKDTRTPKNITPPLENITAVISYTDAEGDRSKNVYEFDITFKNEDWPVYSCRFVDRQAL